MRVRVYVCCMHICGWACMCRRIWRLEGDVGMSSSVISPSYPERQDLSWRPRALLVRLACQSSPDVPVSIFTAAGWKACSGCCCEGLSSLYPLSHPQTLKFNLWRFNYFAFHVILGFRKYLFSFPTKFVAVTEAPLFRILFVSHYTTGASPLNTIYFMLHYY